MSSAAITSRRLRLVVLDFATLQAMSRSQPSTAPSPATSTTDEGFDWPPWWPDAEDGQHVRRWLAQASRPAPAPLVWGPRAMVVDGRNRRPIMVGHVGFHGPPVSIDVALADPSFHGPPQVAVGGVVELGYTVFPDHRNQGFASEAVNALLEWAAVDGDVSTILATVAEDNGASLAVLHRVGGFVPIGRSRDGDGQAELVLRRDLVGP